MLNELKNLRVPGRKEDILFLLRNIIGYRALLEDDLKVLCSHAPAGLQLFYDALIPYCKGFAWISMDEIITVDESLIEYLDSDNALNIELVKRTVKTLFDLGIFRADLFNYNIDNCQIAFRNECLSLAFSAVRNTLISQGFFEIERENYRTFMYVDSKYESIVSKFCAETYHKTTLEQLKKKIENDAIVGEKAEGFVLAYEKRRITNKYLSAKIRVISNIDVFAGYDIISFEQNQSMSYDRYIEVKAVSKNGFYWSANEYETAKRKGKQYYLYLVDISKVGYANYKPTIIKDPANKIMKSNDWFVKADSYHIRKI